MVTCREVRDYLNRSGARLEDLKGLPAEIASHLTSCTSCLADRRVAWLRQSSETAVPLQERKVRPVFWTALAAVLAAAIWLLVRAGLFGARP
ncbi:MAG TPA: hypothetical protein VFQ07_01440 [Candidatus Polarisedimenticolia bacterium]|nr:hypothetical protein [Candidatus Polarisedimenticolia bacterium]